MSRRVIQRAVLLLCMLAGVAVLSVRRDVAAGEKPGRSDRWLLVQPESAAFSVSNSAKPGGTYLGPHHFLMQYDYCYFDAAGRPMIFHRRRFVFFAPASPPEDMDRTYIETDECQ